MRHDEYIAALRRESAELARAARRAGVDAAVPSCPGWTVGDLCAHVGGLQRWWTVAVEERPQPPRVHLTQIETPGGDALVDFIEAGTPPLVDALTAADPDAKVWTWTGADRVRFWARRAAHEVSVHRWDAQLAAGTTEPLDVRLAVDGIQELFDLLPARPAEAHVRGDGETIHLHCTDIEGEWLVRLTPRGAVVTREHAKGDVAARGTASDLLLLMCGRIRPDRVEVFGDASLLARWQELARF